MAGALMTVTTGTGGITATVAAVGLCLSIGAGNEPCQRSWNCGPVVLVE